MNGASRTNIKEGFARDVTQQFSKTGGCLRYAALVNHQKKSAPVLAELEPLNSLLTSQR